MRSLVDALIALLEGEKPTPPPEKAKKEGPAAPSAPPPDEPPPRIGSPQLSANLTRILSHRDPTQAGSIHLLGLESLREKLGNRWEAASSRIQQLAEKLLDQHLGPTDAWFRHGNGTYVVVFATLGPEQARLICAKVVEELQTLLLGHADTESITVHTAVHEIGADVMFVPARLKDMLDGALHQSFHAARDAQTAGGAAVGWAASAPQPMGPLSVKYRPVWDAKRQVLSTYLARCYRTRPGRSPVWGYDCIVSPDDPQEILDVDLFILKNAVDDALELYENRFRFFLSLPVNFESLAVLTRRRQFLAALQDIPAHIRPFITFHLVGAPQGVPAGRLGEMVSTLRPFGRSIMIVVDIAGSDLAAVAASGAKMASLRLTPGLRAGQIQADLIRFCHMAAKLRLMVTVEGVDDRAMQGLCEEAGVAFMSGRLIGEWVDVPENVLRMTRADLIGNQ